MSPKIKVIAVAVYHRDSDRPQHCLIRYIICKWLQTSNLKPDSVFNAK